MRFGTSPKPRRDTQLAPQAPACSPGVVKMLGTLFSKYADTSWPQVPWIVHSQPGIIVMLQRLLASAIQLPGILCAALPVQIIQTALVF